jgi:hypothetical protein
MAVTSFTHAEGDEVLDVHFHRWIQVERLLVVDVQALFTTARGTFIVLEEEDLLHFVPAFVSLTEMDGAIQDVSCQERAVAQLRLECLQHPGIFDKRAPSFNVRRGAEKETCRKS